MMFRIALAAIMVASITGVVALTGILPTSAQSTPSATRSFNPATPATVVPGGTVTVTIQAANYGSAGGVTETLPTGFAYVSSSLAASQVMELSGNRVRFTLQGDTSFTYIVTASSTPGSYDFSGTLRDFERDDYPVGGVDTVTVEAPSTPTPSTPTPSTPTPSTPTPSTPTPSTAAPSATRSFNPATVDPGGTVTVTIEAADYGQAGGVTETLPSGFSYVSSSLRASQVYESGQNVRFTLQEDASFTYTVTASSTPGPYDFSGTLRDFELDNYPVGGATTVTVEGPSATRSFSSTSVARGGRVVVSIRAANYGQAGGVTETLPSGFSYVSSSLRASQVDERGQNVRFTLQGDTSFTYTVTASSTPGPYDFSGTLRDFDKTDHTVGGPSSVQVRRPSPPPPPAPSPTQNRAPVFSAGSSTTRSVNENSASGANVGARVTASDPDGDSLTYTLAGTDAGSFGIVAATGQIRVGDGTNLDYEGEKNTYVVEVTATDRSGASDMITVTVNVTNVGEVTLWASATEALTMAPQVGDTITGAVMDPDGGVTGESWQWARTTTPAMMDSWMDIAGETNAAYTVTEGDTGYYLRVMATYTDAVGTDTAMEYSMPTMMVGAEAGDPLFGYDTSGNGRIDKDELAKAVLDYEVNRTLEKPALADLVFSYELGI